MVSRSSLSRRRRLGVVLGLRPLLPLLVLTIVALIGTSTAYTPKQAIVVVFGRPGSGKTTIAERALSLLETDSDSGNNNDGSVAVVNCLGIDLDVCIPQWMKDNFGKGIYPTLQERQDVAKVFCDYVEKQCQKTDSNNAAVAALVSFSFVNTDLRDIFRQRFPNADWVLVDTSEQIANERMEIRQGHFYTGKPTDDDDSDESNNNPQAQETAENNGEDEDEDENSEWNFAPVDFPHEILDGNQSIEFNAKIVSNVIRQAVAKKLVEE